MQNIERIETKRLIARKITSNDFDLLHQFHLNPTVMATLGGIRSEQQSRENLQWNLDQWQNNGFGLWVWYDKTSHHFVGRAGLRVVNVTGKDEVEVAYALLPQYWNKGFATEIARACVQIAFEKLHLSKLICFTLEINKASRRVMEKVGFQYAKDFIHNDYPHVLYELYSDFYWQHVITFKPLKKSHLSLLVNWLKMPHVKQWWNDELSSIQIKQKYAARIGDKYIQPFIVYFHQKPIGFIQFYYADKVGDNWWPEAKPGTVGIDQFIGEEKYINKGIGSVFIHLFIKKLFNNKKINKIITDVDPLNQRALRCYLKVGFKLDKEVITPDGNALLMYLSRQC